MHHTQLFILSQLCEQNTLRYSEMRPPSMEASRFMYHLHALQRSGLVEKTTAGYRLSAEGKRYVDKADPGSLQPLEQARIAALIVCKHSQKGILYTRKTVQPAYGYIGFPLIDIPIDFTMPLTEYVAQVWARQTGLNLQLQHRGDGYINLLAEGQLEGSLLAHVMYAEISSGEVTGDAYIWESDTAYDHTKVLASCPYILTLLDRKQGRFFFEYSFAINQHEEVPA